MAWAEGMEQDRIVPPIEMFSPTIASAGQIESLPPVRRPKAAFLLDPASRDLIYGPEEIAEIGRLTELSDEVIPFRKWINHVDVLADADVIFSGWSAPLMDERFLKAAPRLRTVFYGAGSVRYFTTPEMWARGITVTSASSANAIPVAEYTVGTVLLSLRHFWAKAAEAREGKGWGDHTRPIPGSFRASVGLLSFGTIGRAVARFLRAYDVKILVHCPYLQAEEAIALGVERVGLEELFKRSDVLSVHTPVLSETCGMVNGRLVASMKEGATLINTARGVILAQREVEEVLRRRPDLHAVLDVTDPEPPKKGDPLLALPNVTVTSHIAGSHGRDCQRMGHYMVEELKNYLAGRPLRWQVTPALLERMA
jgi:phosphoglycerate dehydrogenase-like enzyme